MLRSWTIQVAVVCEGIVGASPSGSLVQSTADLIKSEL